MEERKLALLIDAENTSSKYVDAIISELKKYGVITYQRMYGDFTNPALADWHRKALKYAIVPIQQPRYSAGKNASDIMLVIDAMDILYQDKADGFCIVTSDSDFTRLVNRLREEGMMVIGMGKSDASKTFIAACNEYKFLDKIIDEDVKEVSREESRAKGKAQSSSDKNNSITPVGDIKSAINELIQQSENNGEHEMNLGSLKSNLQRLYPDFDERNYGYSSMRKFISEATKFETMQRGSTIYVMRETEHGNHTEDQVRQFVLDVARHEVEMGVLGRMICERFPDFKYKDLGYSRLTQYVRGIHEVRIDNNVVSLQEPVQ
jgi:predicted nuclease of predicted toxin-antitoxin system